jgi:hypothetical protein
MITNYDYIGRCKFCGDTFVRWGEVEIWPRDVCAKCCRERKADDDPSDEYLRLNEQRPDVLE